MKPITRTLTLFAAGAGLLALPFLIRSYPGKEAAPAQVAQPARPAQPSMPREPQRVVDLGHPTATDVTRKIQVALLLDTSSSMDGLIAQAKTQLWKIVNELARAKKDSVRPVLEIALYEYGKSSLSVNESYIRQILPLTGDLDRISEELFALTTNGGEEYCGAVIREATNALTWSQNSADLRLIFIAGNEPFTQGDVDYRDAIRAASAKGIAVNTIFCGPRSEGIATGWQAGAMLADGRFLTIDQDQAIAYIAAPQDDELARLGVEINDTYIPYGVHGASSYARQQAQDRNAAMLSVDTMSLRASSKASGMYRNGSWDLVDAQKEGAIDVAKLEESALPENMKKMNKEERELYVKGMLAQRTKVQKRIAELNAERTKFVDAEMKNQANRNTLDVAMTTAIHEQAAKGGFLFE